MTPSRSPLEKTAATPGPVPQRGTRRRPVVRVIALVAAVSLSAGSLLSLGATAASAAPSNDNFVNAAPVAGTSGTATGTNVDATKESGEPNHAGNVGGASIWYSWTAPAAGSALITTCGSTFDTLLAVYTGAVVGTLTTIRSNNDSTSTDNACGPNSVQSSLRFNAVAGTTYRIAIDGGAVGLFPPGPAATGSTVLNWLLTPPPANDNLADAEAISGGSGTVAGSNVGATKETGEPNHAGRVGGASIWYRWTPPATGLVTFDTCGTGFDTVLAVYTGGSVAALAPVASNDDSPRCGSQTSRQSSLNFQPTAGVEYRIAVDGLSGTATGPTVLNWNQSGLPQPANDNFANPTIVTGLSGTSTGTNVGATREPGEPTHALNSPSDASIWYAWTAPLSGQATFRTCGSNFDTLLAVYRGTALSALTSVASNNDSSACGTGSRQSSVTFSGVSGTEYRIAVDGYFGATGNTVLSWDQTPPPATDNFASAAVVSHNSGPLAGSNVSATKEAGEPNHAGNAGGASIWYRWTAPGSGSVTFRTCGSSFDTLLGVYTGSAVNGLTVVASNDDNTAMCGTSSRHSGVTFNATAGTTYSVAIDGFRSGTLGTPAMGGTVLNWVASTTTTVGTDVNPSVLNQPVTFTATVTPSSATGTVTFKDGSSVLGSAPLSAGAASLTTSALAAGSHSITAAYDGASNYATTSSAVLAQTVAAAGSFDRLVITPASATVTAGDSQAYRAEGFDAYGNSVGDLTTATTFTIGPDGSCLANSCSARTAGTHTVTASHGGRTTTASLTVVPAAVTRYEVMAPSTAGAGDSFSVTVVARDGFGNVATNYTGTARFTSTDSQASLPANYPFTAADAGSHTFPGVTLRTAGSQTVMVTDVANTSVTGSATVGVNQVAVSITGLTASALNGNPTTQFSDTVEVSASINPASTGAAGSFAGTVTFQVNGKPTTGVAVPVQAPGTVTARIRLDDTVVPNGAGSYLLTASFASGNPNYADQTGTASVVVRHEGAGSSGTTDGTVRIGYTGDQYVTAGSTANLLALAEQGDGEFVDFAKSRVDVIFKIYNAGCGTSCSGSPVYTSSLVRVGNRTDWATTGNGFAQVSGPRNLGEGIYLVVAELVSNGYVLAANESSPLTVASATGTFISGGGSVAQDSTANAANRRGQFGFNIKKANNTLQGGAIYMYRMRIDVVRSTSNANLITCTQLGGSCRDVDVRIRSSKLTTLNTGTATTYPRAGWASGQANVQFVDSADSTVHYAALEFGGGSFRLDILDASPGGQGDTHGFTAYRKDGSVFHQAIIGPNLQRGTSSPTNQGSITGNVSVHPR